MFLILVFAISSKGNNPWYDYLRHQSSTSKPRNKKKALEMQQSVKVKLHWGSPSLSWTTGLKTKCTQSEHMSAERDKTPPVAHRYTPFILQRSQLLLSLNHKELSLCSKSDLWPYQCFLCTCVAVDSAVLLTLISESFMISSPNPSWQFVCVCHCSGATPPSNGEITALHMWDSNAPTSGLNHMKLCHQCCDS